MELSARHSVILSMEIACKEGLTRSPDLKLGPKILICVKFILFEKIQKNLYEIAACFCTVTGGNFVQIFASTKFLCIFLKKRTLVKPKKFFRKSWRNNQNQNNFIFHLRFLFVYANIESSNRKILL